MSVARWILPAVALCFSLSLSHAAQLISIDFTGASSGNFGVGESFVISADGRFAAFASRATNHVAPDTNATSDLFVYDCVVRQYVWDTTHSLHYPQAGFSTGSTPWFFTPDSQHLLFSSTATNLVPGVALSAVNGSQIYVHDLFSNVTTLVSVAYDGTNAANRTTGAFSRNRPITVDARFVAFTSAATNLTPLLDLNATGFDVFCRDLWSNVTELITVSPSGDSTLDASTFSFVMSTNARYFAFATTATNVLGGGVFNDGGTTQIYWRDRLAGSNVLVTITSQGALAAGNATLSDMTSDGRYVCFQSPATNIVANQNDSSPTLDVFIRDMFLGETWLVSRTTHNTAGGVASGGQFSANGQVLIFSANNATLVPGISDANGSSADIFAHYLGTRSNAIVSVSWQGDTGADRFTSDSFGRISATGRYVLFTSTAANLIPGPPAPQRLYLRDLQASHTLDALRAFYPTPAFNEARLAISDDERYIFFLTQTSFDPTILDNNSAVDLYRAPLYQPKFLSADPLLIDALPNARYILETSTNLFDWSPIQTNTANSQGQVLFHHSSPPSASRFYRALWP